jgi:ankyrin repeat protein
MTALHIAAKEGHAEAVRSLMLAGIDMDECTLVIMHSSYVERASRMTSSKVYL